MYNSMVEIAKFLMEKGLRKYTITFLAVIVLFIVGLLLPNERTVQTTAHFNASQIKLNEIHENNNAMAKELAAREERFTAKKEELMKGVGRLTLDHIVIDEGSRIAFDENQMTTRKQRGAQLSRSYERYSPYNFKITTKSAVTAKEIDYALQGTSLSGLGHAFVKAELKTGINALFLTSLAIHESSWGRSALARGKNNLFGFGAYDASPYESALYFDTKEECVLHVAQFLKDHYIEGSYYRGGTIADIGAVYASDPGWPVKVFSTMLNIESKIQNM